MSSSLLIFLFLNFFFLFFKCKRGEVNAYSTINLLVLTWLKWKSSSAHSYLIEQNVTIFVTDINFQHLMIINVCINWILAFFLKIPFYFLKIMCHFKKNEWVCFTSNPIEISANTRATLSCSIMFLLIDLKTNATFNIANWIKRSWISVTINVRNWTRTLKIEVLFVLFLLQVLPLAEITSSSWWWRGLMFSILACS